jgi:hypothetical protein
MTSNPDPDDIYIRFPAAQAANLMELSARLTNDYAFRVN